MLVSFGFKGIAGWERYFLHRELRVVLSVYVGDFKMAGTPSALEEAWGRIRAAIRLGEPTSGEVLGLPSRHA
jgi:hypothetical protein